LITKYLHSILNTKCLNTLYKPYKIMIK